MNSLPLILSFESQIERHKEGDSERDEKGKGLPDCLRFFESLEDGKSAVGGRTDNIRVSILQRTSIWFQFPAYLYSCQLSHIRFRPRTSRTERRIH